MKKVVIATSTQNIREAILRLKKHGFSFNDFVDYGTDCLALVLGHDDFNPLKVFHIAKTGMHADWLFGCDVTVDVKLKDCEIQKLEGAIVSKSVPVNAEWMLKNDACVGGFQWFVATYGKDTVQSSEVAKRLAKEGRQDWKKWLETKTAEVL